MAAACSPEIELEYELGQKLITSDPERALTHLANALTQGLRTLPFLVDLSAVLLSVRRHEEAWKVCELGLQLYPGEPVLLANQGAAYGFLGYYDHALRCFQSQGRKLPRSQRPWTNMGNMLRALGRLREAKESLQTGVEYAQADSQAEFHLSLALLLSGDFGAGFRSFEARPGARRTTFPDKPFWNGAELAGKRILLLADQGCGDMIQCARFATDIRQRGGEPIFEVAEELHRLFTWLPEQPEVVVREQHNVQFDLQSAQFSLPLHLKLAPDSIPGPVRFEIPTAMSVFWASRLPAAPKRRVALTWAGNPNHLNDHNRSLRLQDFLPLLAVPDIQFLSLQMGPASAQISELRLTERVTDLSPWIGDFADTAAILSQVDLVISVDTSVVHLAGTQGVPVWNLLPYAPDWRWMLQREDSPWYPSMRLFRQPRPRDWSAVIQAVEHELRGGVTPTEVDSSR